VLCSPKYVAPFGTLLADDVIYQRWIGGEGRAPGHMLEGKGLASLEQVGYRVERRYASTARTRRWPSSLSGRSSFISRWRTWASTVRSLR
jgi:hypothetical protein